MKSNQKENLNLQSKSYLLKLSKSENAITLIALIITVVVMLILAGVAISVLVNGDGLFNQTRAAAEEYKTAAEEEAAIVSDWIAEIDQYLSGVPSNPGGGDDDTPTESEDTTAPETATLVASEITSSTFTLTATGADSGSGVAKYEFYVKNAEGEFELEETIETTEGTAVYNVIAKSAVTEYEYKVKVYDAKGNSKESDPVTVELTVVANPLGTTIFTENKTYNGATTGTYNNPIIPKGFYPVNENNATWGTEDGYKYGLIISDADLNQYVWVPVDGTNVKFGKQAWYKADGTSQHVFDTTVNAENVSESLPTELTPDANGVIPNGGFYIARYETGTGTVSKAGVNPYASVDWSDAKSAAEGKYASSNSNYGAVSTLIYGAQWDTALNFIQAYNIGEAGYATYAVSSAGYGNYSGTDGAGDTFSDVASCGAAPQFRQKNIYDMAGNVWEWTMETPNSSSSDRVDRGGDYYHSGSGFPAGYRDFDTATGTYPNMGFRLGLYIKGQTGS